MLSELKHLLKPFHELMKHEQDEIARRRFLAELNRPLGFEGQFCRQDHRWTPRAGNPDSMRGARKTFVT